MHISGEKLDDAVAKLKAKADTERPTSALDNLHAITSSAAIAVIRLNQEFQILKVG